MLYGTHDVEVSMGPNSLAGALRGKPVVHFKNNDLKIYMLL